MFIFQSQMEKNKFQELVTALNHSQERRRRITNHYYIKFCGSMSTIKLPKAPILPMFRLSCPKVEPIGPVIK